MCSRSAVIFLCIAVLDFGSAATGSAASYSWQASNGYRAAPLSVQGSKPGFKRLDANSTGILFTNRLADERSLTNRNLLSGSGVAAGDVDGDGLCDLYFCGLDSDNVLYRNLGNWRFEDITASAGVACPGQDSTGATFADIDGDGDLDLLVNSLGGGTRIFRNDGKGHFTEITKQAGVASKTGSMSLALADIDGDGDLDLYVANFRPTTIQDQITTRFNIKMLGDRPVVTHVNNLPATLPDLTNRFVVTPSGSVIELGEPDALYLNDGNGRFTLASFTDGRFLDEHGMPLPDPPRDWGLAVQFHDLNGDGAPDIYVCNDLFTPDRIWINDGKGNFRALDNFSLRNTSTFSMGVDFADIDRNGSVDFFVVDMLSRNHVHQHVQISQSRPALFPPGLIDIRLQLIRNTLQVNRGDGTFAETSYFSGVEASEWSWGPIFLDVDLDGYEDILVTNGQLRDFQNADMANRMESAKAAKQLSSAEVMNMIRQFPSFKTSKMIFRNRGDLTFQEVGAAWGFNEIGISQGMALADLDNDGDMDVVMNNLNEGAGIYRNEGGAPRVAVRLKGSPPNTQGIGAKIKVLGGPVSQQSQEVICGGRYLSGDDPMRVFAAGSLTNRLRIEVTWRNGKQSVVSDAKPNWIYEINESGALPMKVETDSNAKKSAKLFEDVSQLLNHQHHEDEFDDFERQPLLPRRLSQLGPGVAWHDVDGDGWEDLIIGSGRGGAMAVYLNDGRGKFKALAGAAINRIVARDQTTVLGFGGNIVAGSANYEDGLTNGGWIRIYDVKNQIVGESILRPASSTGPLAMADIDGDGDLDLFVGGRVVAGKYPEPAVSMMMRNEGGRFVVSQRFEKLGLVSGAVMSDLDGDGYPELILACEWGPIRVFHNEKGTFKEVTQEMGLSEYVGWWNGVTTGDLDGDGKLDIIASNWGLNSKVRASREHPWKVHYGDLDGNGTVDIIESHYDEGLKKEVPERWLRSVGAAMPFVLEKMSSYEAYGRASVEEIYGERLKGAGEVTMNTLESMVFMNRGGKFEAHPMPREAQWSPGFGLSVGDVDGDGNEDVFMSQNFFAVNGEMTRCDAGRGLWMKGDGRGNLTAMLGQESGVVVYGEQRGCALADYDGDGKLDLVVTQNGAATKLYHNVGGKAGLRVRLKGGVNNPEGIGAQIRLKRGEKLGAVREVKSGSGYWSQEGAVQVMSLADPAEQIWVRWPAGKITAGEIPKGAKEVEIYVTGEIKLVR